jgi:hypothetical protein
MDGSCYALQARCRKRKIVASIVLCRNIRHQHRAVIKVWSNCSQIVVKLSSKNIWCPDILALPRDDQCCSTLAPSE